MRMGQRMSQIHKILIVDSDNELRGGLAEQLALYPEFEIAQARNGTQALAMLPQARPDLILFDMDLPDMNGREAVRQARSHGYAGPVLLLTEPISDADLDPATGSSPHDYITKPFRFAVLLARIRAHLRQFEAADEAAVSLGPYKFRPSLKYLLHEQGHKVRLTEKETAILRFLARAGGQSVARDILLREIWGYNARVSTHTLETHIYRLRQKIEPDPSHARIVLTEPGGYRLNT